MFPQKFSYFLRSTLPRFKSHLTHQINENIKNINLQTIVNPTNYTSISRIRSLFYNNKLLFFLQNDVLHKTKAKFIETNSNFSSGDSQGKEFEYLTFNYLKNKFNVNEYVDLGGNYTNCYNLDTFNITIEKMKDGVPILFNVVLINHNYKMVGIADIVVRSDYVEKIFTNPNFKYKFKNYGCKFNKGWHYIVIDVKYSFLSVEKDGITVKDNNDTKFYKFQLLSYNTCLKHIQNYEPKCAYILFRKNTFELPGEVYFESRTNKKYKKLLKECITWVHKEYPKIKGMALTEENILKHKLFPNMSNSLLYFNKFADIERECAVLIGELTLLPGCGIVKRTLAHLMGVYSFHTASFNTKMLGYGEHTQTAKIINACIETNKRGSTTSFVYNKSATKVPNFNTFNTFVNQKPNIYINIQYTDHFFDDFSSFPRPFTKSFIYVITIGATNKNGEFITITRSANDISLRAEQELITNIKWECKSKFNINVDSGDYNLIYWGNDKHVKKHLSKLFNDVNCTNNLFCVSDALKNHAVGIKDCFGFHLQSVYNSLNKLYPDKILLNNLRTLGALSESDDIIKVYKALKKSGNLQNFKTCQQIVNIKTFNEAEINTLFQITNFFIKLIKIE